MTNRPSRRAFLGAAGVLGLSATDALAFGWCRRSRQVPICPPRPCPPLPQPHPQPDPGSSLRVRQSVGTLSSQQVESLRRGVKAMRDLPAADPRSWSFQANIHGTQGPRNNKLFAQCTHSDGVDRIAIHFLTWHRA